MYPFSMFKRILCFLLLFSMSLPLLPLESEPKEEQSAVNAGNIDATEVQPQHTPTSPEYFRRYEDHNNIIFDRSFSPFSGSEDLLTFHRLVELGEDYALSHVEIKGMPTLSFFGRLVEQVFFWSPINRFLEVVQHEVFGHGFRIRDLGSDKAKVTKYQFDAPFPYGQGGGATHFEIFEPLTVSDLLSIAIAGLEAESIMTNRINIRWLIREKIDPRLASLYTQSKLSAFLYAATSELMSIDGGGLDGDDIQSFRLLYNELFPEHPLTTSQIRKELALNFLDPVLFASIFSWYRYLVDGKSTAMPLIRIGPLHFIPSASSFLTPFGIEGALNVYFRVYDKPFYFYIRGGDSASSSFGIGLESYDVVKWKNISWGFKGHYWQQPDFQTPTSALAFEAGQTLILPSGRINGGAISVVARTKITPKNFSLYTELGAKNEGYLPGYSLKGGLFYRLGVSSRF